MTDAVQVQRHRTAMVRHALSQPMAMLVRHRMVQESTVVLDYGCGRGDDVRALLSRQIRAAGWDPHFAPWTPRSPAAVVNLGFVLNVIEDPAERRAALAKAWALTGKVLAVAVMLEGQTSVEGLRPFGDGHLTSRRTFQKHYQHGEARDYVGAVTGVQPTSVAPGIFFVFRRAEDEQDFLFERRRGARIPTAGFAGRVAPAMRPKRPELQERIATAIAEIVGFALARGRMPHADEVTQAATARLAEERVSLARACGACVAAGLDAGALGEAARLRREDLLVHHALGILNGGRSPEAMGPSLARDVRTFFASRQELMVEARRYLFALADARSVHDLCVEAAARGLGARDEKGRLLVMDASVPDLAGPLRCYIGCATHLCGEPDGRFLVRLDPHRRRAAFLSIDLLRVAFPSIGTSVTVDLARQDVRIDYGKKVLVRKSRLVPGASPRQRRREDEHADRNGVADARLVCSCDPRNVPGAGLGSPGCFPRR